MINTKSVAITRDQAHAIKALREGTADANQQTVALDWIIYQAAGLAVSQFVEGSDDGRRATDFMTGRAFTGQQILGVAMSPMDALFKPGNEKADK
ncbi:hypothetical protein [Neorhizobium sp. AL 9.2.2]|uniref:hypothetical protein n=1 Tax=Neorhizobium sp. AL 9.2.2 TaxID=2712894 RepID=UPI001574B5CB|nr:hypothetical protein [Neorhizobium sp. AL 9.2.2]NSY17258.1 hypothetical protein [Neorhizobium sp. AL 9.2.2]